MSELIRTVAQYPFTAFWIWIAFVFTLTLISGLFKGGVIRFAFWHLHGRMDAPDDPTKLKKEMFR